MAKLILITRVGRIALNIVSIVWLIHKLVGASLVVRVYIAGIAVFRSYSFSSLKQITSL